MCPSFSCKERVIENHALQDTMKNGNSKHDGKGTEHVRTVDGGGVVCV